MLFDPIFLSYPQSQSHFIIPRDEVLGIILVRIKYAQTSVRRVSMSEDSEIYNAAPRPVAVELADIQQAVLPLQLQQ